MAEYYCPSWGQYLLGLLFTATWQAALIAAVAAAGTLAVRRTILRAAIWKAALVALALCPLLAAILPHCYVGYDSPLEPLHFPSSMVPAEVAPGTGQAGPWRLASWPEPICRTIVAVWLCGAGLITARLLIGWLNMQWLLARSRPVADPALKQTLRRVVGESAGPRLLELDGLVGALSWQIHRPMIIVPADRRRLSPADLEMMLQHEWAHLCCGDPLMLFVQRCLEALYWFHPLVWLVTYQASKYREFLCDDQVVACGYDGEQYASCIGRLALWSQLPLPMLPAGLGMLWSQHLVLQRIQRALELAGPSVGQPRRARPAVAVLAVVLVLGTAVVRVDPARMTAAGRPRWTAWPPWSATALDTLGISVRDFPRDAHRYDPQAAKE